MDSKFVGLTGITSSPSETLDMILESYFHSDTAAHGIPMTTNSLRSDMEDGEDIAGNIESSLKYILGSYFTVFSVEAVNNGKDGNNQSISLTISVTSSGKQVGFDNVLKVSNGKLASIVEVGHL